MVNVPTGELDLAPKKEKFNFRGDHNASLQTLDTV